MSHPEAEDAQQFIKEIRRTLVGLVIATVVLFIALGAVGAFSFYLADKNREAICNLKSDLERRVATSEEFTREHPEALEQFGITKARAEKELSNQHRTLKALDVVPCS